MAPLKLTVVATCPHLIWSNRMADCNAIHAANRGLARLSALPCSNIMSMDTTRNGCHPQTEPVLCSDCSHEASGVKDHTNLRPGGANKSLPS